ncbi:MAG: hypothetical protein ROO73_00840 [Roseivirga sp.]
MYTQCYKGLSVVPVALLIILLLQSCGMNPALGSYMTKDGDPLDESPLPSPTKEVVSGSPDRSGEDGGTEQQEELAPAVADGKSKEEAEKKEGGVRVKENSALESVVEENNANDPVASLATCLCKLLETCGLGTCVEYDEQEK